MTGQDAQQHQGSGPRVRREERQVLWTFNTIPRPGEFGNDTWENESWATNGNTGVWTQITVDEEAGLVYLPVESPTSDFYGGHRPGNNLFGESLVCVDLKTGQRKWHFQIVHHPIWDYDLSSARDAHRRAIKDGNDDQSASLFTSVSIAADDMS